MIHLILQDPTSASKVMKANWQRIMLMVSAGAVDAVFKPVTRSSAQNSLMWSCLSDLSRQVEWPMNGAKQKLAPEDWKHILSASLDHTQRVAMGLEGGFVMLGLRTSKMTKREMSELIDLAHAFGDQQSVTWSKTSLGRDVGEEP